MYNFIAMESICERERFAKTLEPDGHVSMWTKGPPSLVPDERSSVQAGNLQTLYSFPEVLYFCSRFRARAGRNVVYSVAGRFVEFSSRHDFPGTGR